MKKVISLLMAVTMIFVLCACNNTSNDISDVTENTATNPTESTNNTENNQNATENKEPSGEIDKATIFNDPNFDDIIVGDNEFAKVSITGFHLDDERGCVVDIIAENKFGKAIKLFVPNISINGIQLSSDCFDGSSEDTTADGKLAAFKTACYEIVIDTELLDKHNITKFTDIEVTVHVADYGLLASGYLYYIEPTVKHIYPYGEAEAEKFVYNTKESDIVLFDNDFAKFIVNGIEYDEEGNALIDTVIINKNDSKYTIATVDEVANDCEISIYFAEDIINNALMFAQIKIEQNQLSKHSIEKITNLKMTIYGGYGHAFNAVTHFNVPVELNFD